MVPFLPVYSISNFPIVWNRKEQSDRPTRTEMAGFELYKNLKREYFLQGGLDQDNEKGTVDISLRHSNIRNKDNKGPLLWGSCDLTRRFTGQNLAALQTLVDVRTGNPSPILVFKVCSLRVLKQLASIDKC
jgi:hypothetical protein